MVDIHVAAPVVSDEAKRLVSEVLASGRLAQGPMVERFEVQQTQRSCTRTGSADTASHFRTRAQNLCTLTAAGEAS